MTSRRSDTGMPGGTSALRGDSDTCLSRGTGDGSRTKFVLSEHNTRFVGPLIT
jgi:hypothetical protein